MSQGNLFADNATRIEYTNRLCDGDPLIAATRDALVTLEQTYQEDDGPQLFQMDRREATAEVHIHQPESLQQMYVHLANRLDGEFGAALYQLAEWSEELAQKLRAGTAGPFAPPAVLARLAQTGHDLVSPGRAGFDVYGMLLVADTWMTEVDAEEAAELAEGKLKVRDMAGRRSLRMVVLYCRDGLAWTVTRCSDEPESTALVFPPESEDLFAGQIIHALSRLVNAMCNNPVPVVPYEP